MKIFIFILLICAFLYSCSKPTPFLVKRAVNFKQIELEDGTIVNLAGITKTSKKYLVVLNDLTNKYVTLYDEDYDPIKEINSSSIIAYVHDDQDNCINDLSDDINGIDQTTTEKTSAPEPILIESKVRELKTRISGKEIQKYPTSNLSELYTRNKFAVFLITVPENQFTYAQGTGFFISASGIGVSNFHVFAGRNKNMAIVKTIDNHQYKIRKILNSNEALDYIVFEVENDHNDFPFLKISSNQSNVGEDVFAIGNPKGLEHTLSKGIVSSYRDNDNLIQTTAEITHGSSGGPLFNMKGEVIGITTSGIGEANLNFAMNMTKLGIKDLLK